MMYLPRSVLLLTTAIPAITHAQFNTDNLIPEWLPQCFDGQQAVNPFEVVDCIQTNSNPTCAQFSFEDSMMNVLQCVNVTITEQLTQLVEAFAQQEDEIATSRQANGNGNGNGNDQDFLQGFFEDVMGMDPQELFNIGRVFVNKTLECLDPYASCVQETIEQAMTTQLQPCINQTLRELVECGQTNQDACLQPCSTTAATLDQTLLEGLSLESVETCGGIQANVMNPLCEVVSCCEPCVAKVEALMQCIVNEQLDQVPAIGNSNTCNDLVCPATPQRRRLRPITTTTTATTNSGRKLEPKTLDDCLQFSPGLTGDDAKEFSARSAVFLPCVSDSFVIAVNTPVNEQEQVQEQAQEPVVVNNDVEEQENNDTEDNVAEEQEENGVQEGNAVEEQEANGVQEQEMNEVPEQEVHDAKEQEEVNGVNEQLFNEVEESSSGVRTVGLGAVMVAVASLVL